MEGRQTHLAVERIRRGIDALLTTDTAAMRGAELAALLAAVEVQRRRLDAVDQAPGGRGGSARCSG